MKDTLKDTLIDFGLPAILIVGSFALLFLGIDGEVKSILLLAAGWAFRAKYDRKHYNQNLGALKKKAEV